jgi:hypothetical protein
MDFAWNQNIYLIFNSAYANIARQEIRKNSLPGAHLISFVIDILLMAKDWNSDNPRKEIKSKERIISIRVHWIYHSDRIIFVNKCYSSLLLEDY